MDWKEIVGRARRFWHSENPRVAAVRDVLVAAFFLGLLLGTLWAFSGQPFPREAPLVVVESGSMMHGPGGGFGAPPFARLGTIDPGDLVIVKRPTSAEDVETAFDAGSRSGYGGHGDVIVYRTAATPIIHRAMLYIEASPAGCVPNGAANPCTFRIRETCVVELFATFVQSGDASEWRQYCEGSTEPITMNLRRGGLSLELLNYPCQTACDPFTSGFITKGDNNPGPDQPAQHSLTIRRGQAACCPITIDEIIGKARGEIPWFGLIKLALFGNPRYQDTGDPSGAPQWVILRARAPWDTWVALFFSIGVLVAAPPAVEYGIRQWRRRRGNEP